MISGFYCTPIGNIITAILSAQKESSGAYTAGIHAILPFSLIFIDWVPAVYIVSTESNKNNFEYLSLCSNVDIIE